MSTSDCKEVRYVFNTVKRFVTFYSEELNVEIRMPIDISITRHDNTQTLYVEIPKQSFTVAAESVYAKARWEG